jgi:hypothetical protein
VPAKQPKRCVSRIWPHVARFQSGHRDGDGISRYGSSSYQLYCALPTKISWAANAFLRGLGRSRLAHPGPLQPFNTASDERPLSRADSTVIRTPCQFRRPHPAVVNMRNTFHCSSYDRSPSRKASSLGRLLRSTIALIESVSRLHASSQSCIPGSNFAP